MANATLAYIFALPVVWYANVAFTIFAPYLVLGVTFLQHICTVQ